MLLDFTNMEEKVVPNMRGGEGSVALRSYQDDNNKILYGRMAKGSSIGVHTHVAESEMIYILSGTGIMLYEDGQEILPTGSCHYCPNGGTHGLSNQEDEELVFLAIVPKHGA